MKISRLKNIIIAMLLAADLVLAAVLGARAFETWRLEEDAAARASEALAALGAEVGRDMLGDEPPPLYIVEIERDLTAERALAETFVGAGALVRDGSGSYRIEGERGTARLHGAGRFEAEITAPAACPDASTFIELAGLGGIETVTGEDTVTQLVRGAPVFGGELALDIENGELRGVSGIVLLGDDYIIDGTPSKSLDAALLSLAEELHDAGTPAGKILSAELGYAASLAAPGYMQMAPTWRIETESAGTWYVDAFTLESSARLR